jgi:hypothetical protein
MNIASISMIMDWTECMKLTIAYRATGVLDAAAFRGFMAEYRMGVH